MNLRSDTLTLLLLGQILPTTETSPRVALQRLILAEIAALAFNHDGSTSLSLQLAAL